MVFKIKNIILVVFDIEKTYDRHTEKTLDELGRVGIKSWIPNFTEN